MKAKTILVVVGVAAVIGLLAYGLLSKGGSTIAVGDPAPDKQLSRLDGPGTGDIADYRGHWVLVNFWASWCAPCRSEAPALESFQREHAAQGFTVLGINLDDNTGDASEFVRRYGLTYPQLRDGDGSDRRDAYGMTGFPESFLVDPSGKLALIRRGAVDESYLTDQVAPLLQSRS
ncbi:MAG TPA: TlpA disulfide reductase family protein [Solirubrobacterales bacterium]